MIKTKLLTLLTILAIVPTLTFAQTGTTTATTTTATNTQIICMQNALEKRETSLIQAHDTHASSTRVALTNRLTGLKASWELEKKARIAKRLETYKNFRTEMHVANTTLRNSKNTSWKTYQADAKACGIKATGESPTVINTVNTSI